MNTSFKYLQCNASFQFVHFNNDIQSVNTRHLLIKMVLLAMFLFGMAANATAQPPIVNALKSAVVPGWGELSLGHKSGYIFLATEATLWSTRFYFMGESDLRLRQAEQFAFNHANLTSYTLNDDIRFLMERFNSSGYGPGGYNDSVIRTAMETYPHDPQKQTEYINQHLLDESISWDWVTGENRRQYRIMRKNSAHFDDYAKVMGGTIILNHVISFLNTLRVSNSKANSNVNFYSAFDRDMTPFLGCVVLF